MSTRFWRRLAGCIAISVSLSAAAPEYRAGAAAVDHVRAVVVEDRRGARAVFAEADFPITRATSDFVAVQLVKTLRARPRHDRDQRKGRCPRGARRHPDGRRAGTRQPATGLGQRGALHPLGDWRVPGDALSYPPDRLPRRPAAHRSDSRGVPDDRPAACPANTRSDAAGLPGTSRGGR